MGIVIRGSFRYVLAFQNDLSGRKAACIGVGAFPEGQPGRCAQLFNSGLRIEVRFAFFPGEADNDPAFIVVSVDLTIGDVQGNETLLDNSFRRFHLRFRCVNIFGRRKGHIDAATDINSPANVVSAFDVHVRPVAISQGQHKKDHHQDCHHEEDGFSNSFHGTIPPMCLFSMPPFLLKNPTGQGH